MHRSIVGSWRICSAVSQRSSASSCSCGSTSELSQTEIAARTGLPLGTVKTRMVRALTRMRELIDEEGLR